nr:MAG: terminase [Sphaerobacter thermophilus]
MAVLMVPDDGDQYWPTLGPQVCEFIERYLVHGPGDLRGQPVRLDEEKRALIYRMYEVYPRGHALEGRRRFKRVALCLPKGTGKTELAAWIAACELHPEAPVRTVGWTRDGEPIGGPVTDPYIPLVAYTEEQSDELAYGALLTILQESPLKDDFDLGLERIMRRGGDGKAVSLASAPSARDGARTTFQVCDETHWWTSPRLRQAHQTMMANLPKRKLADAWMLEITTAPEPGAGSVAEGTIEYARAVADGKVKDARLLFFWRYADPERPLETEDDVRRAVIEASGAAAAWRDIDAIVDLWRDPTTDKQYFRRVWLNQLVQGGQQAFDIERWRELAVQDSPVKPGDLIVLGFDGAQFHDSTAIVATHVETGYQWLAGLWECPYGREDVWQVPAEEVDAVVADLFERYDVWRMYADPPYWQSWVAAWAGRYGEDRVVEWWTNRRKAMAYALEGFATAITDGTISHSGDERLTRHLGNSRRHDLPQRDEEGRPLWLIRKERPDSPHKIDAAMAAVLSWQARTDAVAAGVKGKRSIYETRGLIRL